MPVTDVHLQYAAALPVWKRHRDVLAGEDAVKSAGEEYLAKLAGDDDDDYDDYVDRACFFNATARTRDGMEGLIFRRDAKAIIRPTSALNLLDVDLAGTSFNEYAKDVTREVIGLGRCGTLVDWDDLEKRVYLSAYAAETILNWRTERIGGRNKLVLVVLQEDHETMGSDGFGSSFTTRYRVLRMVGGHYVVELWGDNGKTDKEKSWMSMETRVPLRAGKPLTEIPFLFHGSESGASAVERSPLTDIVFLNLDHFRLDADYKHGVHYTSRPTAWVSGFESKPDPGQQLVIGQRAAWVSEQLGATAGFLEFTGKGLSTFQEAQKHDEDSMAALGARMLSAQKRVAESAEAMAMRTVGEDSILATLARAVASGLTDALRWSVWWVSPGIEKPADVTAKQAAVELNTDFTDAGMTGRDLLAVVAAWQAGAMSDEEMKGVLRRGEMLPLDENDSGGRNTAVALMAKRLAAEKGNKQPDGKKEAKV